MSDLGVQLAGLVAAVARSNLVITLLVKGSVLLVAAAALAGVLERLPVSASLRHWIWTLAFSGLLVSALLAPVLPPLEVPVLPALPAAEPLASVRAEADLSPPGPDATSTGAPTGSLPAGESAEGPGTREPAGGVDSTGPPGADPVRTDTRLQRPATLARVRSGSGFSWIIGIWGLGALAVAVRRLLEAVLLSRMARHGSPTSGTGWDDAIEWARKLAGLEESPRALISREATIPVVWGVGTPTLLIPERMTACSEECKRLMLLHEMVHVRRRDHLSAQLIELVCALYWLNPLVWRAARQARRARELAADEAVLEAGIDRSDYAEGLVEAVDSLRGGAVRLGVAISGAETLERRVRSILTHRAGARELNRRMVAASTAVLALVIVPFTAARPTPALPGTAGESTGGAPAVAGSPSAGDEASTSTAAPRANGDLSVVPSRRLTLSGPGRTMPLATLERRLKVVGLADDGTHRELWRSFALSDEPPTSWPAADVGDVDQDGRDELVALARNLASLQLVIFAEGSTGEPAWRSDPLVTTARWGWSMVVADADADGRTEIVLGLGRTVEVWGRDGAEYARIWRGPVEPAVLPAMDVGDTNDDGYPDLVLGTSAQDGHAVVYRFDPSTGAWTDRSVTESLGEIDDLPRTTVSSVRVRDVDGDGRAEIVGGTNGKHDRLVVWTGDDHALAFASGPLVPADETGGVRDVDAGDLNGDGVAEIVAAVGGGGEGIRLFTRAGETFVLSATISSGVGFAGVQVDDGNGRRELVARTSEGFEVFECRGVPPECGRRLDGVRGAADSSDSLR